MTSEDWTLVELSPFGREEDISFLDDAWENRRLNIVTVVFWAGVGKSTLVNH